MKLTTPASPPLPQRPRQPAEDAGNYEPRNLRSPRQHDHAPGGSPTLSRELIDDFADWTKRSVVSQLSRLAALKQALSPAAERDDGPPGYAGFLPFLYCTASITLGDLLTFFAKLDARFGSGDQMLPIRFNFLGKPSVLVTHPRHVAQVFADTEHFSDGSDPQILARFRRLLGFNLISAQREVWRETRPRTSAYLNGPFLAEYGQVMREVMEDDILPILHRAADRGEPIDIFDTMLAFSSKVVFRSLMRLPGEDVPDNIHPALSRLFDHVRQHVMKPSLPPWVPSPSNNAFKRDRDIVRDFVRPYIEAHKTLDTMLGSIIRAHTERRAPAVHGDRVVEYLASVFGEGEDTRDRPGLAAEVEPILRSQPDATVHALGKSLVRVARRWAGTGASDPAVPKSQVQARVEAILCEGGTLDAELVLQEMLSNLIGGSETTILLMTWSLYYMSGNPDAQERLYREATTDPASMVPIIEPSTMRDRWGYLFNIMRETLRLAPPAAVFNRPVIADVDLDGFTLREGTLVWGCQYLTQRSPHVWQDPERFLPERFEQPVARGSFFPFTLGSRQCVGMNYAYVEAAIALATIAKHFTFECTTEGVGYDLGLTFRPDRKVEVLLHRRTPCE